MLSQIRAVTLMIAWLTGRGEDTTRTANSTRLPHLRGYGPVVRRQLTDQKDTGSSPDKCQNFFDFFELFALFALFCTTL